TPGFEIGPGGSPSCAYVLYRFCGSRLTAGVGFPANPAHEGASSGNATHPYDDVGSDCSRLGLKLGSSSRFKNTLAIIGRSSSTAASFSMIDATVSTSRRPQPSEALSDASPSLRAPETDSQRFCDSCTRRFTTSRGSESRPSSYVAGKR